MDKINLTDAVVLFPTIAAGIIGFFVNRWITHNDKNNDKVVGHEKELVSMKSTLDTVRDSLVRIEGAIERLESKREGQREEFIKLKSSVEAAWKTIDKIHPARNN